MASAFIRRLMRAVFAIPALVVAFGLAGNARADGAWMTWNAGLKRASEVQKPVLVDVYTDWCGWCKRMDRDVYSRAEVRDYLGRHFVTVRLNAESADPASYAGRQYNGRTLAMRFGISGYPTTVFLRPGGEHLVNVPGYVPADQFLLLLRYIGDGHMDRGESFEAFARNAGGSR
jgi:thioredoxin-related protein